MILTYIIFYQWNT